MYILPRQETFLNCSLVCKVIVFSNNLSSWLCQSLSFFQCLRNQLCWRKKLETYEKGDYEGIMVIDNPVNQAVFRWGKTWHWSGPPLDSHGFKKNIKNNILKTNSILGYRYGLNKQINHPFITSNSSYRCSVSIRISMYKYMKYNMHIYYIFLQVSHFFGGGVF